MGYISLGKNVSAFKILIVFINAHVFDETKKSRKITIELEHSNLHHITMIMLLRHFIHNVAVIN